MIDLREIKKHELSEYKDVFIRDYSLDLCENHGYSVAESLKIARLDFEESFIKNTPVDDFLNCIEADGTVVGYIWYSINRKYSKAFISDFFIYEKYRSLGFGKSAISLLESVLLKQSINYLSLRVAKNNPRALSLYENIGFTVSGINLSKRIS